MGGPSARVKAERKWQSYWEEKGTYRLPMKGGDCGKETRYVLPQFPYPSGDGLHMGHMRVYTISDVLARFHRMQGKRVLQNMGADGFGLPAENAAMKRGIDPARWTATNIDRFQRELRSMGLAYDWDLYVTTCQEEYYRWTQYIFLLLYDRGLAYQASAAVNWCPSCQTVLANEQVAGGHCWSCDTPVQMKDLVQWFLRIGRYAAALQKGLDAMDWPEHIKTMQRNWIGYREGFEMAFHLDSDGERVVLPLFLSRLDSAPGITYVALSPESPHLSRLCPVSEGLREWQEHRRRRDYACDGTKGFLIEGVQAIHPWTEGKLPVWVVDYLAPGCGVQETVGVPAHDGDDFVFAQAHDLPIRPVVEPTSGEEISSSPYTGVGRIKAGCPGAGLSSEEVTKLWLDQFGGDRLGRVTRHRVHDWLISRQRYWGTPIPIIHCPRCGVVPVPLKDVPVKLPTDVQFVRGKNPMASSPTFRVVDCPRCGEKAERELDTMDTFMDSTWYFFRYADPHNQDLPFSREKVAEWMPVDIYVGGVEHAVLHLLYARFITHFLYDEGLSPVREPFARLLPQGMVLQDGAKMSKSRGNVVSPRVLLDQYGADTARMFILFAAPPEKDMEWSDEGVKGCHRFLQRLESIFDRWQKEGEGGPSDPADAKELRKHVHRAIQRITRDIGERWHFNTAISTIMELVRALQQWGPGAGPKVQGEVLHQLARLLAPIVPHLAETFWQQHLQQKGSVHLADWPVCDPVHWESEEVTWAIQVNGKLRCCLSLPADSGEEVVLTAARAESQVERWLKGCEVRKVVFVPGRLLNLVVSKAAP
ncbi:leucine--tRNA ligase [Pasteuria penetrans]|uniref:leucine--tRNA ligase n=1 Tax=Pasteuria penetrans TaxID=86005 RepID=UPI000F9B7018|nr:leucine--tRNA ligase [Pasteuria penetrans]